MKEYIETTPDLTLTEPTTLELESSEAGKEALTPINIVDKDSLLTAVLNNDVAALKTYLTANKSIPQPPYPDRHEIYKKIQTPIRKSAIKLLGSEVSKLPLSVAATMLGRVEIVKLLVPYTAKKEQEITLTSAVMCNKEEIVLSLLELGVDVDTSDKAGNTLLMLASQNGHIKIVELLLKNGANIEAVSNGKWTALMLASYFGHVEVVGKLLEKGAKIDAIDNQGYTALMLASQNGHLELVKLLLAKGADIKAVTSQEVTALMLASQNGHFELVKLLLAKGADIKAVTNQGYTALMLASQNGHLELIKLLIAKGADVNKVAENGYTALILASENGHIKAVETLLEKGAKIDAANHKGATALMMASENGHHEVVKLLIAKGADVNKIAKNGYTALILASQNGHIKAVETLLEKGAKIDAANHKGATALMMASYFGHVEVVKLLLEKKGVNIDKVTNQGFTALILASCYGHHEVVKLLLEKGASIDVVSKDNKWTAVMFASEKGHVDIVEALLDHQFKLSQDLAKYIDIDKGFVTEPIVSELFKASNSKYIAGMSAVISNAEEKHFGKYSGELLNVLKENKKELTEMFAKWSKLVQGKLTEKQCEAFADEKPELYKFGQDFLKYVGKDIPKALKFVSNFIKLSQQKMLPYKEMMLSMLCLNKLNELNTKGNFNKVVDLLKAKIITKYYNKIFVEDCVPSAEIKSWLLNDFMKGVATQTELIAEGIAPAELVPAAVVEPEALEVAGELPEDAGAEV